MKLIYQSPTCLLCRLYAEDILNLSLETASGLSVVDKGSGDNWNW